MGSVKDILEQYEEQKALEAADRMTKEEEEKELARVIEEVERSQFDSIYTSGRREGFIQGMVLGLGLTAIALLTTVTYLEFLIN